VALPFALSKPQQMCVGRGSSPKAPAAELLSESDPKRSVSHSTSRVRFPFRLEAVFQGCANTPTNGGFGVGNLFVGNSRIKLRMSAAWSFTNGAQFKVQTRTRLQVSLIFLMIVAS
jgi:hypothetical protein